MTATPEQDHPGRLAEVKQRAKEAVPGPWVAYYDTCDHDESCDCGTWVHMIQLPRDGVPTGFDYRICEIADFASETAEFVAHAREDVDYLIAEVEWLRTAYPARGDAVATWLKTLRDRHVPNSYQWEALDSALEDYRLRADYGLSLTASTEGADGPASSALPAAPDRGGEK